MKKALKDTEHFDRGDFSGDVYISKEDGFGFNALRVTVNGKHPKKRMVSATRVYLVREGSGAFIIDGSKSEAYPDDLFVIKPGSEYEYEGNMLLFEFNISPDNSFTDHLA